MTNFDGTVPIDKCQSYGTVDPWEAGLNVPLKACNFFAHSTEKCAWCRLLKWLTLVVVAY